MRLRGPFFWGETLLIEDNFTDTSGTNLLSHTPDLDSVGGGYSNAHSVEGRTMIVNSANQCVSGSQDLGSLRFYQIDAGQANVRIEADFYFKDKSYRTNIAILRATDKSNFWDFRMHNSNRLEIKETNAGSTTQRAYNSVSPARNTWYFVTFEADGTNLTAEFNNAAQTLTYNSATFNQTETNVAVGHIPRSNYSGDKFDNWKVYGL